KITRWVQPENVPGSGIAHHTATGYQAEKHAVQHARCEQREGWAARGTARRSYRQRQGREGRGKRKANANVPFGTRTARALGPAKLMLQRAQAGAVDRHV